MIIKSLLANHARKNRSKIVGLSALGLVLASGLGVPSAEAGANPAAAGAKKDPVAPIDCPAAQPVSGVQTGQHGTGFTVTRGTQPQPFDVEVLGVMPDAVAPGRDLVLVKVADKAGGPPVIAQGGGIWAGMSGSPVYLGDKLLGSISYAVSFSTTTIGGVTPAEDVLKLLSRPTSGTAARNVEASAAPSRVAIPTYLRRQLAVRTGSAIPATMQQVRVSMGVSGLSVKGVARVQQVADRAGLSVLAHPSASARRPAAGKAMERPTAGGNFAGVASYGATSLTGVGTTTVVCGNQAVAFGHPFTFLGSTSLGANGATSLAIVNDPLGAYKMANVGPAYGTLDADRLSGVRAKLGAAPPLIPIRTAIRSSDDGTTSNSRSDATDERYLSTAALFHVFGAISSGFDHGGPNHAQTSWTITGTRANGKTFTLKRDNRWTDHFDAAMGPSFEVAVAADTMLFNEFEPVRITKVDYGATLSSGFHQETLAQRLVAVNGGALKERDSVTVKPGDKIRVRAVLRPYRSAATRLVDYTLTVPKTAKKGEPLSVDLTAGDAGELDPGQEDGDGMAQLSCLLKPGVGCARRSAAEQNFDSVLQDLRSIPQNNALTVALNRLSEDGPDDEEPAPVQSITKLRDHVVTGEVDSVEVNVR
jgi:hypothetical protein